MAHRGDVLSALPDPGKRGFKDSPIWAGPGDWRTRLSDRQEAGGLPSVCCPGIVDLRRCLPRLVPPGASPGVHVFLFRPLPLSAGGRQIGPPLARPIPAALDPDTLVQL